jgi:hypothetical protein
VHHLEGLVLGDLLHLRLLERVDVVLVLVHELVEGDAYLWDLVTFFEVLFRWMYIWLCIYIYIVMYIYIDIVMYVYIVMYVCIYSIIST